MAPVTKIILSTIALTLALTLTLTLMLVATATTPPENPSLPSAPTLPAAAAKRPSRFLQQKNGRPRNPNAADHCKKDSEICGRIMNGTDVTCCSNKCVDLAYDSNNCGACKTKCLFTEVCCRGECVNLSYDKRHCGSCNHRCMPGGYCIYGLCDYA